MKNKPAPLSTTSAAPAPKRHSIAIAAKRLRHGQVAPAVDSGREVALARNESGIYFIVDDLCPHDGGRLSDGYIEGNLLICGRHNWEFDLTTGQCPYHPARSIVVCPWPPATSVLDQPLSQITKRKA